MIQWPNWKNTRGVTANSATALDGALAAYLEWERDDYHEAVEGIREGYEDLKAGRTRPVEEVFEELRVKHGLPG